MKEQNWGKSFDWVFEIFRKRRLKNEEKQVKIVEEEGEEIVESEGGEGWRGWIFTAIAPNCFSLK